MRIFNLNKVYNIVCNSEGTRSGFRHIAVLHRNGFEIARAKCVYYNRTWECYQFESVLIKIIEDNFSGKEKTKFLDVIKKMGC
jgi:hypothetical protein